MPADTTIEWATKSWNFLRGCSLVSAGCTNRYAQRQAHRFAGSGGKYEGLTRLTGHGPRWTGEVRLVPELIDWPLRLRKPERIFANSMSDLFHETVPDQWIDKAFAVMALAPQHTFLVLTKRAERMRDYLTKPYSSGKFITIDEAGRKSDTPAARVRTNKELVNLLPRAARSLERTIKYLDEHHPGDGLMPRWPLPNVHLGVSCEDQAAADERIPLLLQTPAAVRWVSAEPLLDAVDLSRWLPAWTCVCGAEMDADVPRLDWIVTGGESGPGARPCSVEWIRSIVQQCDAGRVPVFVKQMGSHVRGDPAGFMVDRYEQPDGSWWVPPLLHSDMPGVRDYVADMKASAIGFRVSDRKGGKEYQWPADLRRRELPEARA